MSQKIRKRKEIGGMKKKSRFKLEKEGTNNGLLIRQDGIGREENDRRAKNGHQTTGRREGSGGSESKDLENDGKSDNGTTG